MFKRIAFAALLLAPPVFAQQMTMSRADGEVLPLSGGRMAVLKRDGSAVVVDGVVASPAEPGVDLRRGDHVVTFQGRRITTLDSLMAAYRAAAVGAEIELGVTRGGQPHVVRFPKPAPSGAIAVGGGAAGAGAWVTGGAAATTGFNIAGAQIRENNQGMPEVTSRESHPASASVALRVGDVISSIDGRSIAALAGLTMVYERITAGTSVTLTVKRGAETVDVKFLKPGR